MTTLILKETVEEFKKRWVKLALVFLFYWIPLYAVLWYFNSINSFTPMQEFANRFFISGLFYPILMASVYHVVHSGRSGVNSSAFSSFVFGLKKWLPVIIAGIIADFIILTSFVLIVPGVFFAVRYSLLGCVVCFEEDREEPARIISYRMTEGWFWPVFRTLLLFFVVCYTLSFGIAFIPNLFFENDAVLLTFAVDFLSDFVLVFGEIALVLVYMHIRKNAK